MAERQGETREIPFLENDMRNHSRATGKPADAADAPGQADAECSDNQDEESPKGNITVNVDDAQLDQTSNNQTTPK